MPTATITSGGRITIPREVRLRLGLRTGQRVALDLRTDGVVEMQPERVELMTLFGILRPQVHGITVEEMNRAIREYAGRKRIGAL